MIVCVALVIYGCLYGVVALGRRAHRETCAGAKRQQERE